MMELQTMFLSGNMAELEKKMHRPVPYDSGLNLVRFRAGDKYVGASRPAPAHRGPANPEAAELVLVDRAEDAVVFEQHNWGWGSHFLYAPAYGKYLTAGTDGKISLSSDEPFTFRIYERTMKSAISGSIVSATGTSMWKTAC